MDDDRREKRGMKIEKEGEWDGRERLGGGCCEGKGKGRSLEEEEFYGGGKGERDPRRKEKERMIRKGSGIVKRERRGNPLIKEDIERRGRKRSWEGRKGFSRINHQGFLDSCSV